MIIGADTVSNCVLCAVRDGCESRYEERGFRPQGLELNSLQAIKGNSCD